MSIPTREALGAEKHPRYNPKTTIAVTELVLRGWCGRSDAYLWNVENCQARIIQLKQECAQGRNMTNRALLPRSGNCGIQVQDTDRRLSLGRSS